MPMIRAVGAAGVRANHVTIAAMVMCVAFGVLVASEPARYLGWYVPLLVVRTIFNNLDGAIARVFDQRTALGGYLNEIGDVVSDAAIYLPLVWLEGMTGAVVVGFVVMGMLVEFAGVLGHAAGKGRSYLGPFGKTDRELVVGLAALGGAWWIEWGMTVGMALAVVTVWRRVSAGVQHA